MQKTVAILALAALGITAAKAGVRFGINFGIPVPAPVVVAPTPVVVAPPPVVVQPPMPAPIVEAVPTCPTPGYVWVGGSWGWHDNHWVWTRG
ncbi:MAG TPA: YXWGXW repeat-containing protein [Verrucomicrobiae bacterium]